MNSLTINRSTPIQPIENNLKSKKEILEEKFIQAFQAQNFEEVQLLLEKGVNPNLMIPVDLELFVKMHQEVFFFYELVSVNEFIDEYKRGGLEEFYNELGLIYEGEYQPIENLHFELPASIIALIFKQSKLVNTFIEKGVHFNGFQDFLKQCHVEEKNFNSLIRSLSEFAILVSQAEDQDLLLLPFQLGLYDDLDPDSIVECLPGLYNMEVVQLLEKKGIFNSMTNDEDWKYFNIIETLIWTNDIQTLKYLEKYIPDNYFSDPESLYEAISHANLEVVEFVLSKGGDKFRTSFSCENIGEKPGLITAAVENDSEEVFNTLIDYGFDPKKEVLFSHSLDEEKSYNAPLYKAALLGKLNIFNALLDMGIELKDEEIFQASLVGGNIEIIQKAINAGLDLNKEALSFLDTLSRDNNYPIETLRFLFEAGLDLRRAQKIQLESTNEPLIFKFAWSSTLEIINLLEEYGLDIYVLNFKQENALFTAVQNSDNLDVFDYLVEQGLDVHCISKHGKCLYSASRLEFTDKLKSAGFDPNALNSQNETLFSRALMKLLQEENLDIFHSNLIDMENVVKFGADIHTLFEGQNLIQRVLNFNDTADLEISDEKMQRKKVFTLYFLIEAGCNLDLLSIEDKKKLNEYITDSEIERIKPKKEPSYDPIAIKA